MAIGSIGPQTQPLLPGKLLQSTDSKDDEFESFDPKFSARKLLIEKMFGTRDGSEETLTETMSRIREDSVEISSDAMSLYRNGSMELTAKTADGGEIKISYRSETGVRTGLATQETRSADPLVLDLDGDGIELTDVTRERVAFDINADGAKEQVAWVKPDDGMLVYDRNGNGTIDDGGELFGDQHGALNGFAELAKFDDNGDGVIDRNDTVYDRLGVWRDGDMNGTSEPGEVRSVREYGIESISLQADTRSHTVAGNLVNGYSGYRSSGGGGGSVGEVFLNFVV